MPKILKKSPIHENADANITCDFGDGDISRFRSRLPHTRTHGHIVSSIIVRLEKVLLDPIFMILKCELFTHFGSCFLKLHDVSTSQLEALVT